MVLIRLPEPIRKGEAREFLRIHLMPAMLAAGEADFCRVDIAQPHRRLLGRPPRCLRCRGTTERVGVWEFFCSGCGLSVDRRPCGAWCAC
ncbi:MAG: hypothetical protein GXP27_09045 [Planctomycetes bacterium]|nr:hypothetical protein [Planctomycetota bacterium]